MGTGAGAALGGADAARGGSGELEILEKDSLGQREFALLIIQQVLEEAHQHADGAKDTLGPRGTFLGGDGVPMT